MSGVQSKTARFLKKQKKRQLDLDRETAPDRETDPDRQIAQDRQVAPDRDTLMEKTEEQNSKVDDDTENPTVKRKKLDKAKEYNGSKSSQSYRVVGSVEVPEGENVSNQEDEPAKEIQEETSHQRSRNKENVLTASREDNSLDEGAVLSLAADFSAATLDISKQWASIFNILRENSLEPEVLCTVKLAFKCDGEVKTFSDLQSLRKFISKKSFLRELLKDVFPQNEATNQGRIWIQERLVKASEIGGEEEASEIGGEEASEIGGEEEASEIGGEEASEIGGEEEASEIGGEEASEIGGEEEASEIGGEEASEIGGEEEASEIGGEEASEIGGEEEGSEFREEEEEASELGQEEEEGSEMGQEGEEEHTSGEEEGGENSETGEDGEASVLHEKQSSAFQGLTVVNTKHDFEEISLIGLVIDSESEEEVKIKTKKKKTLFGLKEISFSYLVWDSEKKKLVKCQEEEGTTIPQSQRVATPCLTLYLAPPSESLEITNGDPKWHSCANLSPPSQVTSLLKNIQKRRPRTPQIEELTAKEAALIQETDENFRSVISMFRELKGEIEYVKKWYGKEVLEIKNSVDDLNSLACMIEGRVNDQENVVEGLTKDTAQLAKEITDKERLRDKEDRLRSSNIRVIGIPEKDDKENGAEDIIKEIIEENFPEFKDLSLEILSAHRIPSTVDEYQLTPRHVLVRFCDSSDKQKILRASREREEITYRGTRIRMTADLSPGTIDARSRWARIIEVLQKEGFQPRILYPAKLAFNFKGKTKVFFDIEEFKKFVSDIPSLKELLDNIL
uniref:LINE-1 type transposase domain-containing protein 1 n=1 Tax=Nannospalax galili TaxID=1026970 RepID=A0A8C6QBP9_NANGA